MIKKPMLQLDALFNMAIGIVYVFPSHPLVQILKELILNFNLEGERIYNRTYNAKIMRLNIRNVLAQHSNTSLRRTLLQ